jgi:UDPglucose 6-dehydrogenase
MKISVVGTGHVGLTTAACLAHIGHNVLGVDEDGEKAARIASAEVPFHEPGLLDLVREGLDTGRLSITADPEQAAQYGDIVFVCVGTPTSNSGEADLRQVERVANTLASSLEGFTLIVEKSTVPVGTGEWIRRTIEESAAEGAEFDVASNPEFLQEGRAVRDTLEPSRIVVGAASDRAAAMLREVYAPIVDKTGCPYIVTDVATAELVKHSSNAFLATKISFINQIAEICDQTGADVEVIAAAMGIDSRIGPSFLSAGIGYGGECLPKDVRAFRFTAESLGVDFSLLEAVDRINTSRREAFLGKIRKAVGGSLQRKRIGLWGLAFKPDTDDLRHAPALDVARRLIAEDADVVAHDPAAMAEAKRLVPELTFASDHFEAARGADCVAICTEWEIYASADLAKLRNEMTQPVIVDGRNLLDPSAAAEAGFSYSAMGRPDA